MKKTLITIIALAGMAHADFVWNGGESITQELGRQNPAGPSPVQIPGRRQEPVPARPIPTHGLLFPFPVRAAAFPSWKAGH